MKYQIAFKKYYKKIKIIAIGGIRNALKDTKEK